ncbi:MAG: alpha/beta hydrolase [Mycoplasma sp.]|nr:alpha/beta hydrolase [Mycoplasma sp.]
MKFEKIENSFGTYYHYKSKNKPKATIIFVHGFATNSEYHDVFIRHIIDEFDYIAIQLPGAGVHDWKEEKQKPTVEHMVDYCINLIKNLNLDNFILLGHSMGGGIALRLANYFRKETIALILSTPMNSRIPVTKITNYFKFNPKNFKSANILINILYHDINKAYDNDQQKVYEIVEEELNYQINTQKFMTKLKKSMFSLKNRKLCRKNEKELATPTLVIIGKYDKLIPPISLFRAFFNKKQQEKGIIKMEIMNNSAHLPFKEQEIEYAKEIKDFIIHYLDKKGK